MEQSKATESLQSELEVVSTEDEKTENDVMLSEVNSNLLNASKNYLNSEDIETDQVDGSTVGTEEKIQLASSVELNDFDIENKQESGDGDTVCSQAGPSHAENDETSDSLKLAKGGEKVTLHEAQGNCDRKQIFKKLKKSHNANVNYRVRSLLDEENTDDNIEDGEHANISEASSSSQNDETTITRTIEPITADSLEPIEDLSDDDQERRSRVRARRIVRPEDLDTSSSDAEGPNDDGGSSSSSSSTDQDGQPGEPRLSEKAREVLNKPRPRAKYHVLKDLIDRQYGLVHRPTFTERRCGSLDMVSKFQLAYKLQGHEGCVNSLHFNQNGTKIASGSDDLQIIIWDWERRSKILSFNSGHKANVFQSKFLPGDLLLATCSRDGQVRLAELSVTGALRSTKKVGQHRGPVHKMTLVPDSPQLVLSAGEDGQVLGVDIREQKPNKILLLKNEKDKKVPIYSIDSNQRNKFEFCTAGRDQYVRIFDRRFMDNSKKGEVSRYCPHNLVNNEQFKAYITCAVFSKSGKEVIGSYNDEDIYLFDTSHSDEADYVKKYQGHRNSATVKGVNFYGPNSEFVTSGSDCGNIFFWDKETEAIVKLLPGDDNGVVNVLEPHPHLPVLATSGLDDEVKVWLPTQSQEGPDTDRTLAEEKLYIEKTVARNFSDRESQRNSEPDALDGQMLWVLWRHIRRAERRRREAAVARGDNEDDWTDNDSTEEDEESEEENPRGVQCSQS